MTPTPYFAYASNIVPQQMARRCRGAQMSGVATLPDHRFRIIDRGYGTVVPETGAAVWGVLWVLEPAHEWALDRYEGVKTGLYRKERREVRAPDGSAVEALIYVANSDAPGRPNPGYLEAILAAAAEHRFPPQYLAELRGWLDSRAP